MEKSSAQLLTAWTRGSQSAANELFARYIGRLTALARGKISRRLGRRIDAEDVALSAYRSFFVRARTGRVELQHSGDLWRLLVAIAINKLHRQVQHHRAGKRSIDREHPPLSWENAAFDAYLAGRPTTTAEEAAVVAEEFERFATELSPIERHVLQLRMQDYPQREIARLVGRSERTVRRLLTELQARLEGCLFDAASGNRRDEQLPSASTTSADNVNPQSGLPTKLSGAHQSSNDKLGTKASDQRESAVRLANRRSETFARPTRSTRWPWHPSMPVGRDTGDAPAASESESPACSVSAGKWLSDADFQLSRHLGAGGSGKVYQAWWRSAQEWVAVKVLKKRSQTDVEGVERFLREAVTVSELRHPGIVPIRGIGRLRSGGYFLVFDLVPGGDLSGVMSERQIEVHEALRWVVEAATAVDYAHSHGVIHCDLKPGNLLLDSHGSVRVSDFGLAHVRANWHIQPAPAGTLGFIAPEQLDPSRGRIGPQTDVFGLGAALFALLTGRAPFMGETIQQTIDHVLDGPTPSLLAFRADIGANIDALCQRCLSRSPKDRFQSTAEMAQAIAQAGVAKGWNTD